MTLDPAIEIAENLKQALQQAVEGASAEQALLRTLNSKELLHRAAVRDAFNNYAAHLSDRLAKALKQAGRELGLTEVRMETLAGAAPEGAARFGELLGQIRELAKVLHDQDKVNRHLAERALRCVQSYTRTVRPTGQAYTRAGGRAVEPFATQSQRA